MRESLPDSVMMVWQGVGHCLRQGWAPVENGKDPMIYRVQGAAGLLPSQKYGLYFGNIGKDWEDTLGNAGMHFIEYNQQPAVWVCLRMGQKPVQIWRVRSVNFPAMEDCR